jgi:hypothetical protein
VTVTAPPRPPRPDDPVRHGEFEALVEALIEEARKRAQRRRRRNAAVVSLIALVGVALFALLGRSAQSQTASSVSARSSLSAATATSKIAFISEPLNRGYVGDLYVMNADGSGKRKLSPAFKDMRWSPDGQKIAFVGQLAGLRHECRRECADETNEPVARRMRRPSPLGQRSGLVAGRAGNRIHAALLRR